MESVLTLSIGGLPPLSARGCIQTLMPTENGCIQRTLNGTAHYVGPSTLKYRSTIQCKDKTTLATHGLQPGTEIMVDCIQTLWQQIIPHASTYTATLEREAVSNSIAAITAERDAVPIEVVDQTHIRIPPMAKPIFISYRPKLKMCVHTYELFTDEWGMNAGWRLELEEV